MHVKEAAIDEVRLHEVGVVTLGLDPGDGVLAVHGRDSVPGEREAVAGSEAAAVALAARFDVLPSGAGELEVHLRVVDELGVLRRLGEVRVDLVQLFAEDAAGDLRGVHVERDARSRARGHRDATEPDGHAQAGRARRGGRRRRRGHALSDPVRSLRDLPFEELQRLGSDLFLQSELVDALVTAVRPHHVVEQQRAARRGTS